MYNNCRHFGDVIVKQVSGIAMGTSPAPTFANHLWPYTNRNMSPLSSQLWCCICTISTMTEWAYGSMTRTLLRMTITRRHSRLVSTKVGYSGLSANTLIRQSLWTYKRVTTSLYAKPMALHFSPPLHSCHAPGVFSGLIFGNVLCIHQLCSHGANIKKDVILFLCCLLDLWNQLSQVTPLFQQTIDNLMAYLHCSALEHLRLKSKRATDGHWLVFFHLPYYPANHPSKVIQKAVVQPGQYTPW